MKNNYKYIRTGSFGQKKIYYQYDECPGTKICYIFFHGSFGSGFEPKHQYLSDALVGGRFGSVLRYETSRQVYKFHENIDDFEKYKETFRGKSFADELFDVKEVIKRILDLENSKNTETHLIFIGFSLGGTLASFLINDYREYLKKIILFGSGITTLAAGDPILESYPSSDVILGNYKGYSGSLVLVQGSEDTAVPQEAARRVIFESSDARRRELVIMKGINHRFRTINGKLAELELNRELLTIIKSDI
ncbi:MAG: hypothetical protein WCI88_14250 [Chloroflexota bacterium]